MHELAVKARANETSDSSSVPIVGDEDRAVFGEFLASARRRAGRSLEEIARTTKLSRRYLEALEQGRVEVLPPGMYRRAMVRTYAASVALDPHVALERFDRIFGDEAALRERLALPVPARPRAKSLLDRIAPLGPVLMSTLASVPAIAFPSIRTVASPRLPHPVLRPRPLAAAVIIILAVGGAYVITLRPSEPRQRAGRTAPAALLQSTTRAVSTRASGAIDIASPSTGTSGLGEPASVSDRAPAPPPVARTDQELVVTSTPDGARVTVNGIGWGVTPLTIRHLPPGHKIVRVTKDGYVAGERRVQLGSLEDTAAVRLTLRRRERPPDLLLPEHRCRYVLEMP